MLECMDLDFNIVHEMYRIAYLRNEARQEAEKAEAEKRAKEEAEARRQEQIENRNRPKAPQKELNPDFNPRAPKTWYRSTDVKQETPKNSPPPSSGIDEQDLEELFEDGGLL